MIGWLQLTPEQRRTTLEQAYMVGREMIELPYNYCSDTPQKQVYRQTIFDYRSDHPKKYNFPDKKMARF